MNNPRTLTLAAAVIALVAPACLHGDEVGEFDVSLADANERSALGQSMQGQSMQGQSMQGQSMQGQSMQGQSMQGDLLRSVPLQSFKDTQGLITNVALNGTVFSGTNSLGFAISGNDFIGSTVTATLVDNSPVTLRIDDIIASSDTEIKLYKVTYYDGSAWQNLCGGSTESPVFAIPARGHWDYSSNTPTGGDHFEDPKFFTFGCQTGVIAKCIVLGYKPWKSVQECNGTSCQTLSLKPFHQACTRMMRADFCGTGMSHTVSGTLINLYDNQGIQLDESTTMTLEAEWSPEGAKCVKHLRWTTGGDEVIDAAQADIDANCPGIDDYPATSICGTQGSTFTTAGGYATPIHERALLRNESTEPSPSTTN